MDDLNETELREILAGVADNPGHEMDELVRSGAVSTAAALRAMARAYALGIARAFAAGRAAGREEAAAIADEYHVFETSPAIIASAIRSLPPPPLSKREEPSHG